jgi:hypothetical protein
MQRAEPGSDAGWGSVAAEGGAPRGRKQRWRLREPAHSQAGVTNLIGWRSGFDATAHAGQLTVVGLWSVRQRVDPSRSRDPIRAPTAGEGGGTPARA